MSPKDRQTLIREILEGDEPVIASLPASDPVMAAEGDLLDGLFSHDDDAPIVGRHYIGRLGVVDVYYVNRARELVKFVAIESGLSHQSTINLFMEEYLPYVQSAWKGMRPTRVRAGWLGVVFNAYHDGILFEGWARPLFTLAEGARLSGFQSGLHYDDLRDAFVYSNGLEEEVYPAETIVVDGEEITAYPIGAGIWNWEAIDGNAYT